jgi:hypothetical protein
MKKIYIIMIFGQSIWWTSGTLMNHGGIEGIEEHGDY